MGGGAGGDSTLRLSVFKSLKALAGDNDHIFLILDDRDDLWRSDETGRIPENLLLIPPYFFHQIHAHPKSQNHLIGLFFNTARCHDSDLTLLTFKEFLLGVHKKFFTNIEEKLRNPNLSQLLTIQHYIRRHTDSIFIDMPGKINFLYFLRWGQDDS